jgi:hypothetical protein
MAFDAEKVAGMGAEALRRIILLCVALRKAHLVSETLTLLHCCGHGMITHMRRVACVVMTGRGGNAVPAQPVGTRSHRR